MMGDATLVSTLCNPSLAANSTPPLKSPSIIRGVRPDHSVDGPFVWRIFFRMAKEEEGVTDGGMLLLLMLFLRELMCSSTTLYTYVVVSVYVCREIC